ncbi:acyl-CoA N-acyltransferase [Amylostereum chailletii]|nr:acyl-CoA N-acyltransferase [Amylostereum chailletii]
MSFVNGYKPPPPGEDLTGYYGPDPYDINFRHPIQDAVLETERVKLTPFIPRVHGAPYMEQMKAHPALQAENPFEHHSLENEFLPFFETVVRRNPGWTVFAVIDKLTPDPAHPSWGGSFAGTVGLLNTSGLTTEVGWVITFPAFQRTYVTSNSVGILLRYALEVPTASPPGLGMRRVQWTSWAKNAASLKAATRMQFKDEGVNRWNWMATPPGKKGNEPREGDPKPSISGWDSVMLAICADDWEDGAREKVQQAIDRTS